MLSLAACAEEKVERPARQKWAFDVARDECGVSEIVQEYFETGASRNGRSYSRDYFRRDRDKLPRLMHRGRDWNLLDYIAQDDRLQFKQGCRSDFSRVEIYDGAKIDNRIEYQFRAILNDGLLCIINPYHFQPGLAGGWELETGQVQSCINVWTGRKTFDYFRDE